MRHSATTSDPETSPHSASSRSSGLRIVSTRSSTTTASATDIAGPWETKERVVVSMTGSRGSAVLIRRAARMAMRIKAELVGVHVRTDDSLTGTSAKDLVQNRVLLEDLGGRYVEVVGADVAPALVQVALAENATQLVMGATHRGRVHDFVRGSVINSVIRAAGGFLDVHVIATATELQEDPDSADPTEGARRRTQRPSGPRHRNRLLSPLPVRRRLAAVLIGVIGFPLLTIVLTSQRTTDSLATALSCYLVLVVLVAATGGVWPAVLAAVAGFLLSNYYFAPPIHTFTIADARDVLALAMFLITAGAVSVLVDLATRRTAAAIQSRADATMLARVAGRMVAPEGTPLGGLLDELMVAFRLDAASVLRKDAGRPTGGGTPERAEPGSGSWAQVATAGTPPVLTPQDATLVLPLTEREVLALKGPGLTPEDRDILSAFAAQLSTALERDRLRSEAAAAESLAKTNEFRSALLAAVSHDLRTPLASIQAAASSLLSDEVAVGPERTRDLLHSIEEESERLNTRVEHLLDMSRLQTGSTEILHQSTDVHDGGRGRRRRARLAARPGRLRCPGRRSRRSARTRRSSSGRSPTWSTTLSSTAEEPRCGSRSGPWPDRSTSGSSTVVRASPGATGSASSIRSSTSAARTSRSESGSGSAWPVGSSRRSAGSSTSRTRPAAGAPW